MTPSFSRLKGKPCKNQQKQAEVGFAWNRGDGCDVPPKLQLNFKGLKGVIPQKTDTDTGSQTDMTAMI
jgi:hypothetical protein